MNYIMYLFRLLSLHYSWPHTPPRRVYIKCLFSSILCFAEQRLIGNNFCDTLSLLVSFSYGHQRPWGVKTKFSRANVGDFQSIYNKTKR